MRLALYVFLGLLAGCASNSSKVEPVVATSPQKEVEDAPEPRRVYFLQHKLISQWVFNSEGAFYEDMKHGNIGQLLSAAEEIVTPEYAKGIQVTPIENREAVLITFPPPDVPPDCYYSIVEKVGDGFRYTTYESTIDIMNSGIYGVVGGWDGEGTHSNYGPRTYKSSTEFVADVLGED